MAQSYNTSINVCTIIKYIEKTKKNKKKLPFFCSWFEAGSEWGRVGGSRVGASGDDGAGSGSEQCRLGAERRWGCRRPRFPPSGGAGRAPGSTGDSAARRCWRAAAVVARLAGSRGRRRLRRSLAGSRGLRRGFARSRPGEKRCVDDLGFPVARWRLRSEAHGAQIYVRRFLSMCVG